MTSRERKHKAQDELMSHMQLAFDRVQDDEIRKQMDREMRRVEKLFGYKPGSWTRGS